MPWHLVQRGQAAEEGVRIVQVARNPMANRTRALLAFACPSCQEPLRIKVAHAGKPGKCGHCAATFVIPERPAPASSAGRSGKPNDPWGEGGRVRATPARSPAGPSSAATPRASQAAPPTAPRPDLEPKPQRPLRRPVSKSAPVGRAAFSVVSVTCACGQKVRAPLTRLQAGEARCPKCDEVLNT